MRLDNIVELDENILSFENDKYLDKLTEEMKIEYLKSKIKVNEKTIKRDERFCKNACIFDVTGLKIAWGDISLEKLDEMFGVYYLLSQHKSNYNIAKDYFLEGEKFLISPFIKSLDILEPIVMDIKYIKKNAIARIVDGKIETNNNIIFLHFQ